MNRRDFLKNLFIAGAAAATPKVIFDMGANSYLYTRERKIELIHREFKSSEYGISQIQASKEFEETFGKIIENIHKQGEWFASYIPVDERDPFRRLHLIPGQDLSYNLNYKII